MRRKPDSGFPGGSARRIRLGSGREDMTGFERDSGSDRPDFEERHYSVQQLADAWGLSPDFVRRTFEREPGVTQWVQQARGRRRYRVLRIPESVAVRVYRRALAAADEEKSPYAF